jgi:hypothetical protein
VSGGFVVQEAEIDGSLVTAEGTFSDKLKQGQDVVIRSVLFEGSDGAGTRM